MRVLLDTTYARRAPYSGTAIYLRSIQDALERSGRAEVVPAANPRRRAPAGGGLGSARNLLIDQWWVALELPRLARGLRADVIRHPLPALSPVTSSAQVITVHDLGFERLPDRFDRGFRTFAHLAHRTAARRAGAVICVSHTTADDVRLLWGARPERILVATHGPGQDLSVARDRDPAHFLYVGDDEPRKDLATLLAAYARYRERVRSPLGLVLAGAASAAARGVSVEHHPDPGRLAELYGGAAALVHSSLYEGFGLTLLEAMRAGVPVVAARAAGVVEVCGEAALYAEPADPSSFADAMTSIANQLPLLAQLAAIGRERAGRILVGGVRKVPPRGLLSRVEQMKVGRAYHSTDPGAYSLARF
jgi:glycosyltransferase involved in cell wall biosynthesis